jgi:hypothetical protein
MKLLVASWEGRVNWVGAYLVFDGFEITNTDPDVDWADGLDLTNATDLAAYLAWRSVPANLNKERCNMGVRMSGSTAANHLIFRNLEIHHLFNMGFSGGIDFGQFLDNHVHDLVFGYGWYTHGDSNVARGNRVHHNQYGFHNRTGWTNAVVENNLIYSNYGSQWCCGSDADRVHTGGAGYWTAAPATNTVFRNNVIFNHPPNTYGGLSLHPGSGARVYNNTIYHNAIGLSINGSGVIARNNIIYGNTMNVELTGSGSDTIMSHNLCTGHASCVITTNPLFVNASANDFHLLSTSPAINAGADLAADGVTQDFECTPRPQGSGWDIGADEFGPPGASCGGPPSLPGDLNGDGLRNLIDVRWIIEMLVGTRPKDLARADLDGNGALTLADCQALIKLLVGLP